MDPEPSGASASRSRARVRWLPVALFVAIAYGLLWLAEVPVYVTGGMRPDGFDPNPLFTPLTTAGMFAPAVAAVIVILVVVRPRHPGQALGLVPVRPVLRTVGWSVLGLVVPWLLGLAALAIAAISGTVPLQPSDATLSLLLSVPLASVVDAPFAFGEELGWRGYLLPALLPLGTGPAVVLSGLVWGLWHAPVLLLGYDYGSTSPISLLLMSVSTVLVGAVLAWLRLRSRTLYAACFAHGSLNGSARLIAAAFVAPGGFDIAASLLGWCGWIVIAVLVVGLVAAGGFRRASSVPAER